jgi:hypothetical protein
MNIQMPIDYGKHLYHFTKTETAFLYIIPNEKLKLSSFLDSNDPKENRTFGYWSIFQNCNEFKLLTIKSAFERFLRENCKHLCFSNDYLERKRNTNFRIHGFKHPTMWTHYADNSRGICLVLDKKKFINQNQNLLFQRIKYKTVLKFPTLNFNEWDNNKDSYFRGFLSKNAHKIFFNKHLHWKVEHEIKFIEIGAQEFCSNKDSLVGMYLGSDFDKTLYPLANKLMEPYGWVEKIIIDEGQFSTIPLDFFN